MSCSVSRFCVSPVVSSILEQKKSSDKTRDACIHFLITVVFELLCGIAILSGRRLLWCFVRSCRPVECQCSALHSENLLWFCRKPALVFPKTCFGFSRNLLWFFPKPNVVLRESSVGFVPLSFFRGVNLRCLGWKTAKIDRRRKMFRGVYRFFCWLMLFFITAYLKFAIKKNPAGKRV